MSKFTEPEEKLDLSQVNRGGFRDQINGEKVIELPQDSVRVVGGSAETLSTSIPEPIYAAQEINLAPGGGSTSAGPIPNTGNTKHSGGSGGGIPPKTPNGNPNAGSFQQEPQGQAPPPKPDAFNSGFTEMPEEDQVDSANMLADVIINAYCGGTRLIPKVVEISDKKLEQLHEDGEIDMYRNIPTHRGSHQMITVKNYIGNFNNEISGKFETSEETKQAARPLLAHILKSKGAGMTPEQALIALVAQDLIGKGFALWQGFGQRSEMLNHLRELNANAPKQTAPMPPTPPPVHPAEPVTPQPQQQQSASTPEPVITSEVISSTIKNDKVKKQAQKAKIIEIGSKPKSTRGRKAGSKNKPKI